MSWPFDRADLLREPTDHRPVFQGDIFRNVPIIKAKAGDRPPETDPKTAVDRRTVVALDYPCDMYDHGRLIKVQTVAVVREAGKLGVPDDWDGAYSACPLPDPVGDGLLWAADFLTISPVDRAYLTPALRIASLTELGLAHLRQRIVLYATRLKVPLAAILEAGRPVWDELELWDTWTARGRRPEAFAQWLDQFDPRLGQTRRDALEAGMRDDLERVMEDEAA